MDSSDGYLGGDMEFHCCPECDRRHATHTVMKLVHTDDGPEWKPIKVCEDCALEMHHID